jgi:predicted PhzF superfamily epimerase YddE/YHI9
VPDGIFEGLGTDEGTVFKTSFDYMVVLPNQQVIENLKPNFASLAKVKARGVVTTARGNQVDFVSRCFYPQSGINEDPVTGLRTYHHGALLGGPIEEDGTQSDPAFKTARLP